MYFLFLSYFYVPSVLGIEIPELVDLNKMMEKRSSENLNDDVPSITTISESYLNSTLRNYITLDVFNTELRNYTTSSTFNDTLTKYTDTVNLTILLEDYVVKEDLNTILDTKLVDYTTSSAFNDTLKIHINNTALNVLNNENATQNDTMSFKSFIYHIQNDIPLKYITYVLIAVVINLLIVDLYLTILLIERWCCTSNVPTKKHENKEYEMRETTPILRKKNLKNTNYV